MKHHVSISLLWIASLALLFSSPVAAQVSSVPYHWVPVRVVGGGYVPGIYFHPKQKGLIYARTDIGGAYRWDDSQHRWIALLDWVGLDRKNDLGVVGLALDAGDPKQLFLAVGEYTQSWAPNAAVLRSSDQGQTFERTELPFKLGGNEDGRGAQNILNIDPANGKVLYLGTRRNGLWRSIDRAVTWQKVESFPSFPDNGIGIIAVHPIAGSGTVSLPGADAPVSKTIYAAASTKDGGLFRSEDGGQSWQRVAKQPTGVLITNTALSSNGSLYLSYGSAPGPMNMTTGSVWKLETATGKWTDITPLAPNYKWPDGTNSPTFGYAGVAVSAQHPETILASTIDRWSTGDGVYRSTDGGKHWFDIGNGQQPRYVGMSPWLQHAAGSHGATPWPSTLAIDPFDDTHVLFSTGETIFETHNANDLAQGRTVRWDVGANGIEEDAVLQLLSPPVGPHLFSAVRDNGAYRHDDLSQSPRSGSFKNPEFADTSGIAFAAKAPNVMVRVGHSWTGTVFGATSVDQGLTWTPFVTQPANAQNGNVAISADGKAIVWAGDDFNISVSHDMGSHWTELASLPRHAHVVADPVDANIFYLYDAPQGSVLISTDAGSSFRPYAQGIPRAELYQIANIYAAPDTSGDLWAGSDVGLFHSPKPGAPFSKVESIEMIHAMGFGMAAKGQAYPTIFVTGRVQGLAAVFGSTDGGKVWQRIDDDAHRFGDVRCITGDPRIFARVYIGTEGRGILGGEPMAPPPSGAAPAH